jgi:hypothetical protein
VLASDGVWEFISSQEAVEIVAGCRDVEEACRAVRAPGWEGRASEQAEAGGEGWGGAGRGGEGGAAQSQAPSKKPRPPPPPPHVPPPHQLVDEAYQRWMLEEEGVVDDVTAVVVRFLHPGGGPGPGPAPRREA